MSRQATKPRQREKQNAHPRRGTLVLIAALLMGSALIRLGLDAGQALGAPK